MNRYVATFEVESVDETVLQEFIRESADIVWDHYEVVSVSFEELTVE